MHGAEPTGECAMRDRPGEMLAMIAWNAAAATDVAIDRDWTNTESLAPDCIGTRDCRPTATELPAELRDAVADALRTGSRLRLSETEYAYRMAVVARAATGHRVAVGSAMEACARALGVSRRTLQMYAPIAVRWTNDQFHALRRRRGPRGNALLMSHLLLIAPLTRQEREHWTERVLVEELDVRELRNRIEATRRG
jgi:hypothetical protein